MSMVNLLLVAIGGYLILLALTLTRPKSASIYLFALLLLITLVWDVTYYLELVLPTLQQKVAAHLARFLFLPWIVLVWLAMIRALLKVGSWLPRWFWIAYAAFSATSVLVAMTSSGHAWFQYDFAIHPVGSYGILTFSRGPYFQFYENVQNLIAWFGLFLVASAWGSASRGRRRSVLLLTVGYAVPVVMNTLLSFRISPVPHINLAPFTTIISVSAFAWVVLRHRVMDIIPVARGMLLDSLSELVFVADRQGRLVDINKAAQNALGEPLEKRLGTRVADLPDPWGGFARAVEANASDAPPVLTLEQGGQRRWLEGSCREIREEPLKTLGKLYVFRDVTAERTYRQQQIEYQRVLEERKYLRQQELLVRDLHDGIGGQIAGIGMISALALKTEDAAQREAALRKIMDLAAEGNVEVRSLMNTLESRELLWPDLIVELRRHGQGFQDHHSIGFHLHIEGEGDAQGPGLLAGLSLFRVVKEALNNVAKHAGATEVAVELTLTAQLLRLVIRDNGRGWAAVPGHGRGLRNMRQRIEEMGGTLQVSEDQGARLVFEAPLPLQSPDLAAHRGTPFANPE